MKIKNEKKLNQNIQTALNALEENNLGLSRIKTEIKTRRQEMGEADMGLREIDSGKYASIESGGYKIQTAEGAIEAADKQIARKHQLTEVISACRLRLDGLFVVESKIEMESRELKADLKSAREAYCLAFEAALIKCPEFSKFADQFDLLKAMWLQTYAGNVCLDSISADIGLHDQPAESAVCKAKSVLLVS